MVSIVTPHSPPDVVTLRTPPHSVDAEQGVLGGLLLDNTAWDRIVDVVSEADFYRADHRTIFQHITKIITARQPADALTVAESLMSVGKLADVGGQAYIGSLALNTPSAANIRRYGEIVRERSILRNLAAVGQQITDAAFTQNGKDVAGILAKARDQLAAVTTGHDDKFLPIWIDDAETSANNQTIIKGLIDRGSLVLIYGPSGSGKSFFTVDIVVHIAYGQPWRGKRVSRELGFYVAAEAGTSILRRFPPCRDQLSAGRQGERIPLAILTRGANLLDVTDVAVLIGAMRDLAEQAGLPVGIVVFDTLSRSIPGGDENATDAMTQAIGAADRIRDELGAACVIVHHSGKDSTKGPRGNSSLFAAADTVIQVADRVATVEKSRDGTSGETFPFDLEVVQLGDDADGDPITTCIVVPADGQQRQPSEAKRRLGADEQIALDTLKDETTETGEVLPETSAMPGGRRVIRIENWRVRFYNRLGEDRDITADAKRKAFQRGSKGLTARKIIGISGVYAWIW